MITKKQMLVLDFIKNYYAKNEYSPSLEEIQKHFKLASVSTAHFYVKKLQEKGFLRKDANQPRAIAVFETEKMINIPLLGKIAAGQPIEAIEEKETIAVPQSKLPKSGNFYALKVTGNSMVEENINDGDVVLIKQQSTADNGEKVVALINNNEVTLKKFYKEKGVVRLQPANKNIKPILLEKNTPFKIQGVLIDTIKQPRNTEYFQTQLITKEIIKKIKLPVNQILCGDAIEIMRHMPNNSIDLTVTSPPYDELRNYNGYIFDFENIAINLFRITKKGGVLIWVVGDKVKNGNRSLTSFRQALAFQDIGFKVHDVMIYKKRNTPFMRTNAYTNCFEFMFVLSKDKPKTFNPLKVKTMRQGQEMMPFNKGADGVNKKILKELRAEKTMTNIWEYAVGLHGTTSDRIAFKHPAVFPEKLAENHILSWTKPGDIVFDPMCGSGTTCKMAALNKRHYIGCDISEEYVKLAKERLELNNL